MGVSHVIHKTPNSECLSSPQMEVWLMMLMTSSLNYLIDLKRFLFFLLFVCLFIFYSDSLLCSMRIMHCLNLYVSVCIYIYSYIGFCVTIIDSGLQNINRSSQDISTEACLSYLRGGNF